MFKVFIPVQQSSKTFPTRNRLQLHGEPLWLRCLRRFEAFQIFVDTDSPEIIQAVESDPSLKHVRVYSRDKSLLDPGTSVNQLIQAFLDRFRIFHEPVIQMHVTTPFLRPSSVLEAASRVRLESDYDSAVSATQLRKRLWRRETYGFCPVNHNPLDLQSSEALPPMYIENSAFFVFQADVFRQTSNRVGFRPWFHLLDHPENVEVKTEADWAYAQWIASEYGKS